MSCDGIFIIQIVIYSSRTMNICRIEHVHNASSLGHLYLCCSHFWPYVATSVGKEIEHLHTAIQTDRVPSIIVNTVPVEKRHAWSPFWSGRFNI